MSNAPRSRSNEPLPGRAPAAAGDAGAAGSEDIAGEEDTVQSDSSDHTVKHFDPVVGTTVSGYVVKGRLGAGGMGIVYEGEQPVIGKRVAIKVLRPEVADNPDVVKRLVSEARAVNSVGHRSIIDVFGFGELPDGRQCIVMEYLDGEPLEGVLRAQQVQGKHLPLVDVLVIVDEILSGLAAAHSAGVIHRDLKPSNIFLCRQRDGTQFIKLLDFGIAKLGVLAGSTPTTRASLMVGTPAYMAPEQAAGGMIGPPMDLYALGIIIFELVTGRTPFMSESVVEMLIQHRNDLPPRLASLAPLVPNALDELVDRLLRKKPEDRPQSADAVRAEIARIRQVLTQPIAPAPTSRPELGASVMVSPSFAGQIQAMKAPAAVTVPVELAMTVASPPSKAAVETTGLVPRHAVEHAARSSAEEPALSSAEVAVARGRGPLVPLAAGAAILALAVGGWFFLSPGAPPSDGPAHASAPLEAAEPARPVTPRSAEAGAKPPATTDVKPSAADAKPTSADVKPTSADAKPSAADAKPTAADARPSAADAKPSAADAKPSAADAKPSAAARVKSPAAEAKPAAAPSKPVVAATTAAKPAARAPEGKAEKALGGRVAALEARLKAASARGASVELFQKQMTKIRARLSAPGLSRDDRDSLEAAIARLEESSDY